MLSKELSETLFTTIVTFSDIFGLDVKLCSCILSLLTQFLEYLDRELIPSQYPEVSTKAIDQIIVEPLCFEGNELQVQASSTHGWSFNFDKTSVRSSACILYLTYIGAGIVYFIMSFHI